MPIQESGQLNFIDSNTELIPGLSFLEVNGHTEAMMLPFIKYKNTTVAFMADLIPSVVHLPIPYVMGYDTRPLETLKEKDAILKQALENNWTLFFEHDPITECINVERTEKGIRKKDGFLLSEIY